MPRQQSPVRPQRTGVAVKVTGEIIQRHANVRALWLAVQNDPVLSVQDAAVEFFHLVGDLFEGKRLDQLEYRRINKARVLQHAREG